jgi:hypothetical protein
VAATRELMSCDVTYLKNQQRCHIIKFQQYIHTPIPKCVLFIKRLRTTDCNNYVTCESLGVCCLRDLGSHSGDYENCSCLGCDTSKHI